MNRFARLRHPGLVALLIALISPAGCKGKRDKPLFELLSPERTGIAFANTITTSDSLNVQTDVYVYNGAGVAVGDVDNDGLTDVYFAGNMVSSRLYLNKGEMRFDDITERAGVGTRRWATGATMVDINGDGFLDIYVSVSGPEWSRPEERANLLFVNNGDRTFTESAARYGVADSGFSTHAVFLDYDGDGCLDLFVLNNSPADFSRGEAIRHPTGVRGETYGSHNQLYRNGCRGTFANVSEKAGILREAGYGLGVVVSDLNRDGRPDIYVSNDATPNDVLYVNNGDGTFTDRAPRWLKHASFAGMGVDAADFNNDGWPDILQVDMLARDPVRRKRTTGYLTYDNLLAWRGRGFRDDVGANTLQLSTGVTRDGELLFSDVAHLAGVAATDWSWSALFADFDNDGLKDIFISNGYPKGVNDLDYQGAAFSARRRGGNGASPGRAALDILAKLPGYEEPNYVFRNTGALAFSDESKAWGIAGRPSFSYGAAYADLDNDGRLDLVVSNIDAPAFVYRNVGAGGEGANHYLQLRLVSETPHQRGLGTTLVLTAGGRKQFIYHSPYRGYMSTMDDRVHFGLGAARRVDTLEVHWPDGRRQLLTGLDADRLLVVKQSDATERTPPAPPLPAADRQRFQPLDARGGLAYRHEVGSAVDFGVQPLLPYMVSRQGPAIAVADVNGDSLDDLFLGGGGGVAGRLLLQRKDGAFAAAPAPSQPWGVSDAAREDWGALFFDANRDGRPDLYVASGGYQVAPTSALLQDRLYINQGGTHPEGTRFVRDTAALPVMLTSTAAVRAGDFNGDGWPDLFVGGRLTPRSYPLPTRSYVLRNDPAPDGSGRRFTDVTEQIAPTLASPGGMITDALWIDFDGDGRLDLVTAGEWMPIQFFRNDGTRLVDVTARTGLPAMRGWWYSLAQGDFDGDGRPDLVAGNLGLNQGLATSKDRRLGVYAADFTGNQTTGIVLTQEIAGTEYPVAGLALLGRQIYSLDLRFPTHAAFAQAPIRQLFEPAQLEQALHYQVDTFASVVLRNGGGGKFSTTALPPLAQISPTRAIVVHDVDGDGHLDLILAGNIYGTEPNSPRADAGNGLWLRGDPSRCRAQDRLCAPFTAVPPIESGFLAPRDAARLALLRTPNGRAAVIVGNTGDSLQAFSIRKD